MPGTGQEIIKGAREHREHQFKMDAKLAGTARMSLIFAFIIMLVALGIAAWLASNDQQILAGLFGAGGLAPIIAGMIRGGGRWSGR